MQLEICNVSAFTFSYVYVNYVWGWNSYIYLSINTYTMKQLENIFVSLMASSKNYLGNHSKFPLCLVENWFKSLWKVPLDLATYISRTETDLMRFVHWVLRHHWVSCTLCPDTWLIYHSAVCSTRAWNVQTCCAYPDSFMPEDDSLQKVFPAARICTSHFMRLHIKSLEIWNGLLKEQAELMTSFCCFFLSIVASLLSLLVQNQRIAESHRLGRTLEVISSKALL